MPSADLRSMHMAMAVASELGESGLVSSEHLSSLGSKEARRSTGHSSGTIVYRSAAGSECCCFAAVF